MKQKKRVNRLAVRPLFSYLCPQKPKPNRNGNVYQYR